MATQTTVAAVSSGWTAVTSAGDTPVILQNQSGGLNVFFRVSATDPGVGVTNGFYMCPNIFIRLTDLAGTDVVWVRAQPVGPNESNAVVEVLA